MAFYSLYSVSYTHLEKGYEVGLISKERYDYVCKKKELIDKEIERVSHVNIGARADVQEILKKYNSIEPVSYTHLDVYKRQAISIVM